MSRPSTTSSSPFLVVWYTLQAGVVRERIFRSINKLDTKSPSVEQEITSAWTGNILSSYWKEPFAHIKVKELQNNGLTWNCIFWRICGEVWWHDYQVPPNSWVAHHGVGMVGGDKEGHWSLLLFQTCPDITRTSCQSELEFFGSKVMWWATAVRPSASLR